MRATGEPPRIHRPAVRIACLDSGGRLLMMRWRDPASGEVLWEPPGGGVEPGESDLEAARREWSEETGLPDVLSDDPRFVVVHREEWWNGRWVVADEPVFLARWGGPGPELSRDLLMPDEQVNLVQTAWLTRAELESSAERVIPDMVGLLGRLGAGGDWADPVSSEEVGVPALTDGVVALRAHRDDDLDAIVEQCGDPLMVRFTTVPDPYARGDAERFLAATRAAWADPRGSRAWAIEVDDNGSPRFAGTIDYRTEAGGAADVGFGLHPWARGHGHMARALRLVAGHAFDSGVDVLHWRAQVGNWASRRTAWACGFSVEGTVTGLLESRGRRHDGWIGTLRRGEPMTAKHPWHVPAVLDGDTVRLRPWRDADRPRGDQQPDAASLRFMPFGAHPRAEEFDAWLLKQRTRMASGESVAWCIADAGTDEALGLLSLFRLEIPMTRGSAEVGYWLHESARGRGAIRESIELAVEHAFARPEDGGLGLHRLAAGTDIDNRASELVLRRAGFSPVGIEHEALAHLDEAPTDGPLWELLASTDRAAIRSGYRLPVVLGGVGVRLRPWQDTDAARVVEACSDETTRHFLHTLPSPYTLEHARSYLRRAWEAQWEGSTVYWCIADAVSDESIGSIAVMDMKGWNPLSAELGYWLHPAGRGRGAMTEALQLVVEHAFTAHLEGGLGLERLALLAAATNTASQAVARRAGFVHVGTDRKDEILGDGTVVDLIRFDRLLSDQQADEAAGSAASELI